MRINVTIKLGISCRITIPTWGAFLFIYKERRKDMKKIWIKDIQKNYKKLILTLLIGIFTLFVIKHIH